jgi:hypothetical protein
VDHLNHHRSRPDVRVRFRPGCELIEEDAEASSGTTESSVAVRAITRGVHGVRVRVERGLEVGGWAKSERVACVRSLRKSGGRGTATGGIKRL